MNSVTPISQTAIADWIERLRESTKAAPWANLVDFDGIDAIDVLLSPVFLGALNAVRGGARPRREPRSLFGWLHETGYRMRTAAGERLAARHSASVEQADVVMWCREITHSDILRPVAKALAERGTSCRFLTCQTKIFRALRRNDPAVVFAPAAWPRQVREGRQQGLRRAGRLASFGPWTIPRLDGASMADLESIVRDVVVRHLPLASEAMANARAALDGFRPKVLVVGNDLTPEGRAACRVAAARGVPTAVFMHGSIAGEPLHAYHCADRVVVFGNIHRDQLVMQGLSSERIAVCGSPSLDQRPQQTGQPHPLLRERLGLGAEPWILVATSGPGHSVSHRHHELVVENLARLSTALGNVPIVIKLHRKDRLEHYQKLRKTSEGSKLFVLPHGTPGFPEDIYGWLQGCGLVLTGASTVAVEAMLMDVPVVTMDFCDELKDVDFIDCGATVHVRTREDLEQAARSILADGPSPELQERVRAHLQRAFYAVDGGSAGRAVGVLDELMAGGPSP